MQQLSNTKSLALVARALSEEYGVIITIGGRQAMTLLKKGKKPVINIPAIDSQDQDYLTMIRGYL